MILEAKPQYKLDDILDMTDFQIYNVLLGVSVENDWAKFGGKKVGSQIKFDNPDDYKAWKMARSK